MRSDQLLPFTPSIPTLVPAACFGEKAGMRCHQPVPL
jgi:hypothetical protein